MFQDAKNVVSTVLNGKLFYNGWVYEQYPTLNLIRSRNSIINNCNSLKRLTTIVCYTLLGICKIMAMKIEISQKWFIKVLIQKLKEIDKKLIEADELSYSKKALSEDEIHNVWQNIRDSNLEIEELIDALE